jgi:hypothetical protein
MDYQTRAESALSDKDLGKIPRVFEVPQRREMVTEVASRDPITGRCRVERASKVNMIIMH